MAHHAQNKTQLTTERQLDFVFVRQHVSGKQEKKCVICHKCEVISEV